MPQLSSPLARLGAALAVSAAALIATPVLAQTAALESQRQAVFAQLLNAPADRALMREYARLSVQVRDYEAAAATLERFLDLDPGNSAARLELAQAYFALGAYDLAEYHLSAVARAGGLSAEDTALVANYRDEVADRDGTNRFSGRLALGYAWQNDADQDGLIGSFRLEWRHDMGGPDANDWLTQFAGNSFAAGDGGTGDRQLLRLRTGPEFRLTGTLFGPRLQPYLQFTATRDEDEDDLNEIGIGLAYQNPHTAQWTTFADLYVGRAEDQDTGVEIDVTELTLGATYRPTAVTRARLTLNARSEAGPVEDSDRAGVRLDVSHAFQPGFTAGDREWVLGAHLQSDRTEVTGGFSARTDDRLGYGVSLRAFFTEDGFVEARASRVERDSTLAAFDAEETVFSLQLGWEF